MDNETWEEVVKWVSPGIRIMKVIIVTCVFPVLLSIYLTIHLCPFKFSSYYFDFPK